MVRLPPLPFDYEDLEPIIGKEAMWEHHRKHHKGYVEKLNKTLSSYPTLLERVGGLGALLANPKHIPLDVKKDVVNFGGGVYTHNLFWKSISPYTKEPYFSGSFRAQVEKDFGGIYELKKKLIESGKSHFGSGWVWLIVTDTGLRVQSLDNQLTPLMRGHFPLLCIDLWEHVHYLDYKSDREGFLKAIVGKINWNNVQRRWDAFTSPNQ